MKSTNTLYKLSIFSSLVLVSFIVKPAFANTLTDVEQMNRGLDVADRYHLSVEKMHMEVYERLKLIQANKTDSLKSRIVGTAQRH